MTPSILMAIAALCFSNHKYEWHKPNCQKRIIMCVQKSPAGSRISERDVSILVAQCATREGD